MIVLKDSKYYQDETKNTLDDTIVDFNKIQYKSNTKNRDDNGESEIDENSFSTTESDNDNGEDETVDGKASALFKEK